MRLLFISNLFPDTSQPWRGLDNVTLLHAMREQHPAADIRVLCLRPGHGYWAGRNCSLEPRAEDAVFHPSYHWAPYIPRFGGLNDLLFERALRRALKSLPAGWQPEALLTPWLFPDAAGVNRCSLLSGLPMVAIAQGSDVHRYLDMPMRRKAILNLASRAQIVTRSEDLRQRLLSHGADEDRVHTVYNGVHNDIFRPGDKRAARESLGLPIAGKIALFVGNFLPVKGLDLLVRACASVNTRLGEPFQLVVIGSGPLEDQLVSLAGQSGLSPQQFFRPGRRSPEEVAEYMRAADVVCLSSLNEGVPNVVLEALASGRPLVSTDVGGIGEILSQCPEAGKLVPGRNPTTYADQLLETLQNLPDPAILTSCAASFSWPACAAAYWRHLGQD